MALQIIGAGLGRTGTASLKVALEMLGIGRCYHMGEVVLEPRRIDQWLAVANGSADWESIFEGYCATVDYPACTFWRELSEAYPDAKVLLSTRDAASWFESTNATILAPHLNDFIAPSPWGQMVKRTVWDTLDGRMGDREFMVSYFERRNEEIRDAIPSKRLLVYEVGEGWARLCEFLDVPVPDEPFPRINTRDETRRILDEMVAAGGSGPDSEAMTKASDAIFGGGSSAS